MRNLKEGVSGRFPSGLKAKKLAVYSKPRRAMMNPKEGVSRGF
jgi:hypothetical protein